MKNEIGPNPEIEWRDLNNVEHLHFTFKGIFTYNEAVVAAEEWKKHFAQRSEDIILIWNCLQMKDYEPMARNIWQKTIKELKAQINEIWLITDSKTVRAGAKILALFTSFDIKVIKSSDEIVFKKK